MIEQQPISHHIQKHIISVLLYQKHARFRDLRPLRTDTNLFSYHLKALVKEAYVDKTERGYTLSLKGLVYVDRISTTNKLQVRTQPKIISMLVVQNGNGDVLLQKRIKQPYIDEWTLPYGKLHIEDASVQDAGRREVKEKLGVEGVSVEHAGDCYIRVSDGTDTVMTTLAHVFRLHTDAIEQSDTLMWARPHKLGELTLAPAVEKIVARTFFRDPFFFEEYDEALTL